MPHSQKKRARAGEAPAGKAQSAPSPARAPSGRAAPTPATPTYAAHASANHNGNGSHNGNHNRRSGRVTYRPKATEMLTVHARTEDERLLSPRQRPAFLDSDPWRSLRIMSEFVEGFDALAAVGKAITVFGSARVVEGDPYYAKARQLAGMLAGQGFAVITGGGPGIMEAVNKGASQGGGKSIGLNIELSREQVSNRFVNVPLHFHYFFARKVCFAKYSLGFVFMPGGFGTLDEFFEITTLVQTERIPQFPLILFGKEHWKGLLHWLKTELQDKHRFISPGDLDLVKLTNDPQEAVDIILDYERRVGQPGTLPKAFA